MLNARKVVEGDGETRAYHQVTDQEFRYRQRYADLAVHPEVREVFARRADEGVEALGDGRWVVGIAVAGPETTAEVVDLERAEGRDRRRNGRTARCRGSAIRRARAARAP